MDLRTFDVRSMHKCINLMHQKSVANILNLFSHDVWFLLKKI